MGKRGGILDIRGSLFKFGGIKKNETNKKGEIRSRKGMLLMARKVFPRV